MEIPFLGKFGPKHWNYHFKLKFGTYSNSGMQNSMVMFILSVFDLKYPFWANLVQKIKIVTLSWNLVPTLIRTWRIQWWCSFFLFLRENILFGKFGPKSQNCHFKLKFGQWSCPLFLFLIGNAVFGEIWCKKSNLCI